MRSDRTLCTASTPSGAGRRRGAARLILVAAAATVGLLFAAEPASAHATLVASTPTDGAVWDRPPEEVWLQFNGPVGLVADALVVLDRHGERVDVGPVGRGGTDAEIRVALRADLPTGTYVVTWRASSDDGHPVSGAFLFSVGVAGAVDPIAAAPPPADAGLRAADVAVRTAWYVGAFMAIGGVVFLLVVRDGSGRNPRRVRRVVLVAALSGVAATVMSLPVQAALTAGTWSSAFDLDTVLAAPFGAAAGIRAAGLVLIMAGGAIRHPVAGRWVSGVGAVAAVFAFSQSGHAVTITPRLLAVCAYVVHAAAAATWFGGLAALAISLWRRRGMTDDAAAARMAIRYSALAAAAVTAIGAAGLVLAYLQVGTLDGLTSGYGLVLLLKVGLVAIAGAFGWYNRVKLIGALRRGPQQRHLLLLRRLVSAEAAIIAVVLAVTAVLSSLDPPRADAELTAGPVNEVMPIGELTVRMTVAPARVGINTVTAEFTDSNGKPVHPGDDVSVEFSLPERDIAQITRIPAETGTGTYRHQGPELALPGRWRVEVQTRTSDFTFDAQHVDVQVP